MISDLERVYFSSLLLIDKKFSGSQRVSKLDNLVTDGKEFL